MRSVKFVHMRASQSGLQQQQGEETAVGLYIIVVFIFSQYYRIEKMLLLATWLLSKGLDSQTCYVIHCYTESALSCNGHKSSNIRRINVLHGTRTHWWIKTSWKSSLSMSHPTCYMLQLAVFMLISATALRVSVSHQTADSSWITPADYTPDFTSVWPCKLNYYYVFTARVFFPLKMNSASVILFKKIHF